MRREQKKFLQRQRQKMTQLGDGTAQILTVTEEPDTDSEDESEHSQHEGETAVRLPVRKGASIPWSQLRTVPLDEVSPRREGPFAPTPHFVQFAPHTASFRGGFEVK